MTVYINNLPTGYLPDNSNLNHKMGKRGVYCFANGLQWLCDKTVSPFWPRPLSLKHRIVALIRWR